MPRECTACGSIKQGGRTRCLECGATSARLDAKSPRKRLSIPVVAILSIGFVGALALGDGKPSAARARPAATGISASVDGQAVQVSGPAIAMLEQQLAPSDGDDHKPDQKSGGR